MILHNYLQLFNHLLKQPIAMTATHFIRTFAEDALVNDIVRNFRGKALIKNWSDREIIDVKVTFAADEIIEHYGDFIVTALQTVTMTNANHQTQPIFITFLR